MRFEFDPAKSAENRRKHGIDFEAAQELWAGGRAMRKKLSLRQRRGHVPARIFDEKFDRGEGVTSHLNLSRAVRRVNVDLPLWEIEELDREANRLGITRQALIKVWLAERLERTPPTTR